MKTVSLIGTAEVAQILGCSAKTVIRLALDGKLPFYDLGFKYAFNPDDVEFYLKANYRPVGPNKEKAPATTRAQKGAK